MPGTGTGCFLDAVMELLNSGPRKRPHPPRHIVSHRTCHHGLPNIVSNFAFSPFLPNIRFSSHDPNSKYIFFSNSILPSRCSDRGNLLSEHCLFILAYATHTRWNFVFRLVGFFTLWITFFLPDTVVITLVFDCSVVLALDVAEFVFFDAFAPEFVAAESPIAASSAVWPTV